MKKLIIAALAAAALISTTPASAQADEDAAHPELFAKWNPGVIKVYAANFEPKNWRMTQAIRAWRPGLPAGYALKAVSTPCAGQVGCVTVTVKNEIYNEYIGDYLTGHADWTIDTETGTFNYCDISLLRDIGLWSRKEIFEHELGHCLGLPHREFASSSMYVNADSLVTSYDIEWLYWLYTK